MVKIEPPVFLFGSVAQFRIPWHQDPQRDPQQTCLVRNLNYCPGNLKSKKCLTQLFIIVYRVNISGSIRRNHWIDRISTLDPKKSTFVGKRYHPISSSVNRIGQTGQRWVYRKPKDNFRNSIPVIRDRSIVIELSWIHPTKVILVHQRSKPRLFLKFISSVKSHFFLNETSKHNQRDLKNVNKQLSIRKTIINFKQIVEKK